MRVYLSKSLEQDRVTRYHSLQLHLFPVCRIDAAKGVSSKVAQVSSGVATAVGSAIGNIAAGTASAAKKRGMAPEGSKTRTALRTCKAGTLSLL
jgi:hypothetical protein